MIGFLKQRVIFIIVIFVIALVYITPNFVQVPEQWLFSKKTINYGLDIQGGLHLVLQADVQGVIEKKALNFAEDFQKRAKMEGFPSFETKVLDQGRRLKLILKTFEDLKRVKQFVKDPEYDIFYTLQLIEETSQTLTYRFLDLNDFKKRAVQQAVEVIRNRVDEFGVTEPNISSQGDSRVVVQFPGVKDTERVKELINSTALLEFRIVSDEIETQKLISMVNEVEQKGSYSLGKDSMTYKKYVKRINKNLKSHLPKGYSILFGKVSGVDRLEEGKIPYLVQSYAEITGEYLESAQVGYDSERFNMPLVNFKLTAEGGRRMYALTSKNVQKQMAIVLDLVVISAPAIQTAIRATGSITLGSSDNPEKLRDEAYFLATILRVGALPIPLEPLEEKTVGPTLGYVSIAKGKRAGLVAGILIFLFLLMYYRKLGIIADVALTINVILILAILTSLGATLTLPGVAGIILTMGMAVDANVIIFERIKEELKKGASQAIAVRDGFSQAFSAIFDANVTTAAVCIVLMYFGTGPIRGFAVTLMCGLITSMFTAIFVSRTVIETLIHKMGLKKII